MEDTETSCPSRATGMTWDRPAAGGATFSQAFIRFWGTVSCADSVREAVGATDRGCSSSSSALGTPKVNCASPAEPVVRGHKDSPANRLGSMAPSNLYSCPSSV